MRNFLKSSGRWLGTGWFWALVLLALPTCGLDSAGSSGGGSCGGRGGGTTTTIPFDPGPEPTSAIMCDIPKPNTTQCAMPDEVQDGIASTHAAVALVQLEHAKYELYYSMSNACPNGLPMRTEFFGQFFSKYPWGLPVCLDCGKKIPNPFLTADEVCVAKCKDLINADPPPGLDVNAHCAKAHVSTNFDKTDCYLMACSGGTPLSPPDFIDRRRFQEKVTWVVGPNDGTAALENGLARTKPTTVTSNDYAGFDAGSAASQVVEYGDGWVEFEAGQSNMSHVLGVSTCQSPCALDDPHDSDPSLADIEFAIRLHSDGSVYVREKTSNTALVQSGPYGDPYVTGIVMGERFRVKFAHNIDGKAIISYSRLIGECKPGTACVENEFHTSAFHPDYPLRVDTSFREQSASLEKVTIVRIR